MAHSISSKYTNETFGDNPTLDEKILIFEDRVRNWHLHVAKLVNDSIKAADTKNPDWSHAGFGLVTLLFTYFEMIAQYKTGISSNGASEELFCYGLNDVYPGLLSKGKQRKVYARVRCGMYHNAFIKKGTLIDGGYTSPLEVEDGGNVKVNPHTLYDDVQKHFDEYISELKCPSSKYLRSNFDLMFAS